MKQYLLILAFSVLFCNDLLSQINTDRPSQTESSSVVPKGSFQIESGIQLDAQGFGRTNTVPSYTIPITALRFGLTNRLELRMFNRILSGEVGNEMRTGIGDLEVGFKYQIYSEDYSNSEFALVSQYTFITGSGEFSSNQFSHIHKLAASHSLNNKLSFSYNIGTQFVETDFRFFLITANLGYQVNEKVSIFIEPYTIANGFSGDLYMNTGSAISLTDRSQFDFSFGTGIGFDKSFYAIGYSIVFM